MRGNLRKSRVRLLAGTLTFGTLFQFGGCQLGEVTATTTLDGREVIINLIRSAVLTPLDAYITAQVNNLFDDEE